MASLFDRVVKIAYSNPRLRPHLLPLLKEAQMKKKKDDDDGDKKE